MPGLLFDLSGLQFDPSFTLDSGQAFRWRPLDDQGKEWIGVISDTLIKVSANTATMIATRSRNLDFGSLVETYFSCNDDLEYILSTFPVDENLRASTERFAGLRLLTQDPWECLISFVCSINCNIPSIKLKIENLSMRFGRKITSKLNGNWYSFPTPDSLARAEKAKLLECKVGFRWKYIKFIAEKVKSGELDLQKIAKSGYLDARSELISEITGNTFGVGPKVADCALLYSLHKTEAFPIDVWILRCLKQCYQSSINLKNWDSLTSKAYFAISDAMRRRFGRYAGYAQMYLYAKMRSDALITRGRLQA